MPLLTRRPLPTAPFILMPGKAQTLRFFVSDSDAVDSLARLRLRADAAQHPSLLYEGGLPLTYRSIDDALCEDTHHSRFCLKFSANGEAFPRRAHYKIDTPPMINTQFPVPSGGGDWLFTCWVKSDHLALLSGGCAKAEFALYRKQAGKNPRDINGAPDEIVTLDLSAATDEWTQLSCPVPLTDETAAIVVSIGVERARGALLVEDAVLQNGHGFNILPPFDLSSRYHEYLNWYGENLSHKEWFDLRVRVNDGAAFDVSLFQRCYRGSENEIRLPAGVLRAGENTLVLQNVSDYLHPLPVHVQQLELLFEKTAPVRLLWCPETVAAGKPFGVLLKTYAPDVTLRVAAQAGLSAPEALHLSDAGLHVLHVTANAPSGAKSITVTADGHSETATIRRVVSREEDGVLAGSGDAIYVPQNLPDMEDFLVWYLENGLGNLITFRPVYRWSGTRSCNHEMWQHLTKLLNDLGLSYCHMFDGRELCGLNANPTRDDLSGRGFVGAQAHERDGALYYWLQRKFHASDVFFEELSHRILRHPDYPTYHPPVIYDGENTWLCFSPNAPRDMKEAAEQFVTTARGILCGMQRHTGPSVLFKYFYQAGLDTCGAELMYGSMEVVLAALRGASRAYHKDIFTAHLAVQWSTTPHDTPERYRRYQLALFICYLQGVSHINTEEGLYRMEEMFAVLDRFSAPCQAHQNVERDFVRYISARTRRGTLHRGVALLHGAYDGWTCFYRKNAWAQEGGAWAFSQAEESWDLIRVFYPDSVLDAIYRHPCPNEPQGFYSRTPYGAVDILPVEAEAETMAQYAALAFLGWNTADEAQIGRLTQYVRQGGTLVLGWPHLNSDVRREDVFSGHGHLVDASKLTGVTLTGFTAASDERPAMGLVTLGKTARAIEMRDGLPLVISNKLGAGEVLLVNVNAYPAHPAVRGVYEALLRALAEKESRRQRQKGWLVSKHTVQFCAYDRPDGSRDLYAVDTDWYSSRKNAPAALYVGEQQYPVSIRRGVIHCFTVTGGLCAEVSDMQSEVLSLTEKALTVQGVRGGAVTLYRKGGKKTLTLEADGITEFML